MINGELRWRCRRGMKELDQLLLAYAERHYESATEQERRLFNELLTLPDPLLWGYFSGRERPSDAGRAAIVDKIVAST